LLADDYSLPADSKRAEIAFKDNLLTIATKEHPKTFFTTGPEEEPEGIWSIRIGPDRVEDLCRHYIIPELHLLDQLFYRIQRRQPVVDIASSAS